MLNLGEKAVQSSIGDIVRFNVRGSKKPEARFGAISKLPLSAVGAAVMALATVSCGTRHATLNFSAPTTVTAGSPFTVAVTVMIGSERDTIINNRIHFSSSDTAAVLPGEYYFTPADRGSHTWTEGFILMTPGKQTISGKIIEATEINGTANIVVSDPNSR
jgi:hypothetical protein